MRQGSPTMMAGPPMKLTESIDRDRRLPIKKTKKQYEQDKQNLIKVYNQSLAKPQAKHTGKNSISSWEDEGKKQNPKINTRTLTESEDISE